MEYAAAIGLEIHIRLKTQSKLFCGCAIRSLPDDPNRHVCPICLGHPGTLPRLNRAAIEQGIRVALALGMGLAPRLEFARKHYHYPDLSKNYQTSQFYSTLARGGTLEVVLRNRSRRVRLREAHLEEDAARLVHAGDETMVDFNRGGAPLLELVTEPDLEIGEEAWALLRQLRVLLRTIEASDADMEEGHLRCDANVSVAPLGAPLGTRVELKNMNSPRFVRQAIEFEVERQSNILRAGGEVRRETRTWNENRGVSEPIRSKELAHDYRYLPEPDLARITIAAEVVAQLGESLPELPLDRERRLRRDHGLSGVVARELVAERSLADYFEACVAALGDAHLAAAWIINPLRELLHRRGETYDVNPIAPERLAALLAHVRDERISSSKAKRVLARLAEDDADPTTIIDALDAWQISDPEQIRGWVEQAVGANAKAVTSFRGGKFQAFEFLVGRALGASRGKANPRLARAIMQEVLDVARVALVDMGGAITADRGADGAVYGGGPAALDGLLEAARAARPGLRVEHLSLSRELSENLSPREWSALWRTLHDLAAGEAHRGVVVTHGLDTLAYTSSLMRWLLPDLAFPVVFTGSALDPGAPDSDAPANLERALAAIEAGLPPGVWISVGAEPRPAVNLQMVGIAGECFAPRNVDPHADPATLARGKWDAPEVDAAALERAVQRTLLLKVYPGLDPTWVTPMVQAGPCYLLLELFDTGTANVRWDCGQSILPLVRAARENGGAVFCTSQLGIPVDLEGYSSSRALWNAGVVPLGGLVTESAFTKLIAAQLLESQRGRIIRRMIDSELAL